MAIQRSTNISGAWLVRALASSGRVHSCGHCGARMFVKAPSGLCPVCFTRQSLEAERVHSLAASSAKDAADDWSHST